MDIKLLSIDQIGLSVRSTNALHRAGVHTVGDMLEYDEEQLSDIHNLGKKSVNEILQKIAEYKKIEESDGVPTAVHPQEIIVSVENIEEWIFDENNRAVVLDYLAQEKVSLDVLDLLSTKAFNVLFLNGYEYIHQVAFKDIDELMMISRMDEVTAAEVKKIVSRYIRENKESIFRAIQDAQKVKQAGDDISIYALLANPEYHDVILRFVQDNDREIARLNLPARPMNRLLQHGYTRLSDIIFIKKEELYKLSGMGENSVTAVLDVINCYLQEYASQIVAICLDDQVQQLDDDAIRRRVLKLYQEIDFQGLSLNEMTERLNLGEKVTQAQLKRVIGSLLAENKLEYVDFRCYRVYEGFLSYLERCVHVNERSKEFIKKKIQGLTLEAIAQDYDLTRERVRQIIKKEIGRIQKYYTSETNQIWFDEDYYRYFFEMYSVEKQDAIQWLGITQEIYHYLDLIDANKGEMELDAALEDRKLDVGFRLKIKNYLNRNKLFVGGQWIDKKRADIEDYVVKEFCQKDVSFREFVDIYNGFLEREEIPFDDSIYYTEAIERSRKNRLAEARCLLWKQNEQLRYYDIDSREYTELLDELNLEVYEDIEISTLKLMKLHPEIMKKYDIQDQYELHNLLRKVIPEGRYHGIEFKRMPGILFGTFDRTSALLALLVENTPVETEALVDLIHEEYGYDRNTILSNYLPLLSSYYHNGIYSVEQKEMSHWNKELLQKALVDDFYYIDEIRDIYSNLIPNADLKEVNPYNLKSMGFLVLSKYVVQNYPSLEAYYEDILTRDEITDITEYRKRFGYIQAFYSKLIELKRKLEIIEFEPNQTIHIRKLEKSGVTRQMLHEYCDCIYDFVEGKTCFTIQSIKQDGFESELHDLGFEDWFYANVLISDDRFSYSKMGGTMLFRKGSEPILMQSFFVDRIQDHGKLYVYELLSELKERFGFTKIDRTDLLEKTRGSEIYYDKYTDAFYRDEELYYRELDEVEGGWM